MALKLQKQASRLAVVCASPRFRKCIHCSCTWINFFNQVSLTAVLARFQLFFLFVNGIMNVEAGRLRLFFHWMKEWIRRNRNMSGCQFFSGCHVLRLWCLKSYQLRVLSSAAEVFHCRTDSFFSSRNKISCCDGYLVYILFSFQVHI